MIHHAKYNILELALCLSEHTSIISLFQQIFYMAPNVAKYMTHHPITTYQIWHFVSQKISYNITFLTNNIFGAKWGKIDDTSRDVQYIKFGRLSLRSYRITSHFQQIIYLAPNGAKYMTHHAMYNMPDSANCLLKHTV